MEQAAHQEDGHHHEEEDESGRAGESREVPELSAELESGQRGQGEVSGEPQ